MQVWTKIVHILRKTTPSYLSKYTLVSIIYYDVDIRDYSHSWPFLQSSTSESQSSADALKSILHKKPVASEESNSRKLYIILLMQAIVL